MGSCLLRTLAAALFPADRPRPSGGKCRPSPLALEGAVPTNLTGHLPVPLPTVLYTDSVAPSHQEGSGIASQPRSPSAVPVGQRVAWSGALCFLQFGKSFFFFFFETHKLVWLSQYHGTGKQTIVNSPLVGFGSKSPGLQPDSFEQLLNTTEPLPPK